MGSIRKKKKTRYPTSKNITVIKKVKARGGGSAIYDNGGSEAKLILEDHLKISEIVAMYIKKINLVNILI